MKPSEQGVFFVRKILTTDSISLIDTDVFPSKLWQVVSFDEFVYHIYFFNLLAENSLNF